MSREGAYMKSRLRLGERTRFGTKTPPALRKARRRRANAIAKVSRRRNRP